MFRTISKKQTNTLFFVLDTANPATKSVQKVGHVCRRYRSFMVVHPCFEHNANSQNAPVKNKIYLHWPQNNWIVIHGASRICFRKRCVTFCSTIILHIAPFEARTNFQVPTSASFGGTLRCWTPQIQGWRSRFRDVFFGISAFSSTS